MFQQVGCQSMVAPIKTVLLKHPRASHVDQETVDAQWQALNYPMQPSFDRVVDEFERFAELLNNFGLEISYLPPSPITTLDSIYTHDPVAAVSRRGVILGAMGKPARRFEPDAVASHLTQAGIPLLGRILPPGQVEGGDVCWLDERTVAVGEGYRTNAHGIGQLRALLGDLVDEVIPVQLPHWTGPDDCLHLLSIISPVDRTKAVVYSRMMSVPFRQLLLARGYTLIEAPDAEVDGFGCNVLAVAPGVCIMLEGNPLTQMRLEQAGVEVFTFEGNDLCLLGGGGPTCLTRPLLREV